MSEDFDFYAIIRGRTQCPILTRARLRGFFVKLLRQHYQNRQHVEFMRRELDCLVYEENLSIESSDVMVTGRDPKQQAIFIGFAPVQFSSAGQQDGAQANEDGSRVERTMIARTQLIVSHIADSIDIADNMAESSAAFLFAASEQFLNEGLLSKFSPAVLGQAQPYNRENRPSGFRVDVLFDVSYQYHVTTTLESHRLKRFVIMVEPIIAST